MAFVTIVCFCNREILRKFFVEITLDRIRNVKNLKFRTRKGYIIIKCCLRKSVSIFLKILDLFTCFLLQDRLFFPLFVTGGIECVCAHARGDKGGWDTYDPILKSTQNVNFFHSRPQSRLSLSAD